MYTSQPLTPFEVNLMARLRTKGAACVIHEDRKIPNWDGGRALVCDKPFGLVYNCEVDNSKYALTVYGCTGELLVKNFRAGKRLSSTSIYGSGIEFDGPSGAAKPPSTGALYVSNAYCDLDQEMLSDYKVNNSEAFLGETGNAPVSIRQSVFMRGGDAGIDSKTPLAIDSSFILGNRAIRNWGQRMTLANCIILVPLGGLHYWSQSLTSLEYYNCKWGYVGDKLSSLVDDPPTVLNDDGAVISCVKLRTDPFNRSLGTFWVPVTREFLLQQIPPGFLDLSGPLSPPTPAPTPTDDLKLIIEESQNWRMFRDLVLKATVYES